MNISILTVLPLVSSAQASVESLPEIVHTLTLTMSLGIPKSLKVRPSWTLFITLPHKVAAAELPVARLTG